MKLKVGEEVIVHSLGSNNGNAVVTRIESGFKYYFSKDGHQLGFLPEKDLHKYIRKLTKLELALK
jgi:hypothetical protein